MSERRADIDGLRAIAALTVLVYHGLEASGRGNIVVLGWLGVSGFFALSGYLVTAMLATEHARTGRIDVRAFWRRRAARLAPALLVMVAVVGPVAAVLGASSVGDALTAITPWSNVVMRSDSALGTGFGHAWSIAIEAQFYMLWPALVPIVLRLRRPTLWLLAGAAIVVAWRMTLPFEAAYYGSIARADAFLVGGAIALSGRARIIVPWASRLAPVGVRSYGLYLWHVPIFFIASPFVALPLLIGLSFALAAASWRYVERPSIRRFGRRARAPRLTERLGAVPEAEKVVRGRQPVRVLRG